jgi:glycogen synthase
VKVLMLGWEFPPFISGGLGTACYGLTKGMSELGTDVLFVLPGSATTVTTTHVKFAEPRGKIQSGKAGTSLSGQVELRALDVKLYPYRRPDQTIVPVGEAGRSPDIPFAGGGNTAGMGRTAHQTDSGQSERREIYGKDLHQELFRYTGMVGQIAGEERFDVIHAHDWMTYPAGVQAAQISGKPLVIHVHSTEFDRSGENVNPWVYDIERQGMHRADRVITVSNLTRNICTHRYGTPAEKIHVVYNGIGQSTTPPVNNPVPLDEKIVLFLGRITMQKGPEYFVAAAKKVLEKMDNVKFIIAGTGDMLHRTIEQVARLGLGHKILFAGFLRGSEVDRIFKMADVYVMPSVSEPFGIAPLEAIAHGVPAIISKQSGVSEVLTHTLKVDFWDIHELANKIVAVLKYPPLHHTLRQNGKREAKQLRWIDAAQKCVDIYRGVTKLAS